MTTSTDAYIKHNQRTVRRPCQKCGSSDLYWAHDTGRDGRYCAKCSVSGRWVMIERDGTLHRCFAKGEAIDQTPDSDDAMPADLASTNGQAAGLTEAEVRSIVAQAVAEAVAHLAVTGKPQAKAPKGSHVALPKVLAALQAGESVMLVGQAGTGKSTIAQHAAEALSVPFDYLPINPMTSKSDVLGYFSASSEYVASGFRRAYEHGGVFLLDEFDSGNAAALTILNAALANGHASFPDALVKRHPDFYAVAAANTHGRGPDRKYVGRAQLDSATLDRFVVVTVDTDEALETRLCEATGVGEAKAAAVIRYIRQLRRNAETYRMPVDVSTRASVGICRLINAGWTMSDAIDGRARRGLDDASWAKLSEGAVRP